MFKEIFGKFSLKEEASSEEEVQSSRLNIGPDFIASQVFIQKGSENSRQYCAAYLNKETNLWDLKQCSHIVTAPDCWMQAGQGSASSSRAAIRFVTESVKRMQEEGLKLAPMSGGNYREIVGQHVFFFGDHGDLVAAKKDTLLTKEALLNRKGLDVIYGAAAKAPDEKPAIATWDDFYRDVVSPSIDIKPHSTKELIYLMRRGEQAYRDFLSADISSSAEAAWLLDAARREIGEHIKLSDMPGVRISSLEDVIMQGPDPYVDKVCPDVVHDPLGFCKDILSEVRGDMLKVQEEVYRRFSRPDVYKRLTPRKESTHS